MPSKALQRLKDRVHSFSEDLELADLIVTKVRSLSDSDESICQALEGQPERHVRLHARGNTAASRGIVSSHFRKTIQVAFIKDLHEDFSEFLSTALGRAALTGIDPNRYTGDVKIDIKASELLAAGSWEAVVEVISGKIFRALENEKSTKKLIRKITDRLGIALGEAELDAAMPYLDARHLFVHSDGVADDTYKATYPEIALNGDRIAVNFAFLAKARETVLALACRLDEEFINNGLAPAEHRSDDCRHPMRP